VLPFSLIAKEFLQKNYFVDTDKIKVSTITLNPKDNILLFTIEKDRYFKRVKAKDIIKLLKTYGYNSFDSKTAYVKFTKKSHINLSKLENEVKNLYKNKYTHIKIKNISINPRSYIKSLPKSYQVKISPKSYLCNNGIFYIKTPQRKKVFFDYCIDAEVQVLTTRKNIKKGMELSLASTRKKQYS